jgi:hypothetical protein
LAEVESTAKNLLIALAGVSLKAGETTEKVSILAGQLKEIFLFLVIIREEEIAMALRVRYIICRLVTPKV